jgi:hypothetical protein
LSRENTKGPKKRLSLELQQDCKLYYNFYKKLQGTGTPGANSLPGIRSPFRGVIKISGKKHPPGEALFSG